MKYEEKGKGVMIRNMQEEGIELDRICRISGKTAEEVQRILESK